MSQLVNAFSLVAIALLFGANTENANSPVGCQHTAPATVEGGVCKAIGSTPEYAVRGATPYDQVWIDQITEAQVAACGYGRPKPRPPEFDRAPISTPAKPAMKPVDGKRWWQKKTS